MLTNILLGFSILMWTFSVVVVIIELAEELYKENDKAEVSSADWFFVIFAPITIPVITFILWKNETKK